MATHTRVNQDSKEKWAMDVNVANPIEVEVSDIQIGAVELKDGTTDARAVISGTDGLLVNLGSNNDITGTVTANAGTNLNTSALALETGGNLATIAGDTTSIDGKITACNTGAVVVASGAITETNSTDIKSYTSRLLSSANAYASGATLATTSLGVGGQYNATPPTMTDTHSGAIQLDVNGNLKTIVKDGVKVDCNGSDVTIDNASIAVTGTFWQTTQPISGSVTVSGTATTTPTAATAITLAADGQVKATAGTVYAIHLSFVGVTAGDKIELKNSADDSGTALITLVAPTTAGSIDFCPSVGIAFDTGIYSDETKNGGTFTATIVYC